MALYAIGDVQGCYKALTSLLDKLAFTSQDQLWFVGDLVNRGPESLQVLRLVCSLGNQAITVLGNHDIHLLCVANGARAAGKKDTLGAILKAPDRDLLLDWLRQQPLFHFEPSLNTAMVHAGVQPDWTLQQCLQYSRQIQQRLASSPGTTGCNELYGDHACNEAVCSETRQLRYRVNVFTRMRFCHHDASLNLRYKGPLRSQPVNLVPWFDLPNRKTAGIRLVFGHWSALGLYSRPGLLGLDSGYIWGGALTAARLDCQQTEVIQIKHSLF